ncbi:cytochrome c-type biogenesis protein [Pseudomonas sp.]|uniref:cytochrome c-type biogenesis protein n=1 Tax=Pseudomonas sp. TaxID=306 RepID=UPI002734AEA5|nr:cytochrome c-type biogenesis protein [Pseudomonas sp.]MDP3814143.1 cytochrome c-type biogenesis protein CcmH [Pseudomonas sp.]
MRRLLTAVLLGLALLGTAQAAIDTYEFASEAERERYRDLVEELRCPKCQNQNIADSNAPIAMDLRAQIYRMLEEGQSNEQIIEFLVSRYGDFVLYKPPLSARTLLLWYGPAALLVGGFVLLGVIVLRRRGKQSATSSGLSADEQQRLAALLSQRPANQGSANQSPVDKKD